MSHGSNYLTELNFYEGADSIADDFYKENVGAGWPKRIKKAINDGKVSLGMNSNQVIASWGQPKTINRSVGRWGVHEQWVYVGAYIYFENEKVTAWQD